jgi:hypothetical protein
MTLLNYSRTSFPDRIKKTDKNLIWRLRYLKMDVRKENSLAT